MLLNARRLLMGTAQPASILLAIEDVTERRSAEDTIRRVAALVEGTEDAVIGKTLDGIITSWNRGAEQMFGYAADEVVGRPITIIIPPERRDEEVDILSRLRRGEGTQYETVRVRKDGIRRDVALTVSPVRDAAGRVTPRGGRVDIRLARRDSVVEISVRDSGEGIRPQELPSIFDRFGVAHSSTQAHGGLGLGLSIVRQLVRLHSGNVRADSAGLGQGATFTVALPVTTEDAGDGEGPEAAETAGRDFADARLPALNGVRVLVVDDEADARDLMRAVFTRCGAEVTVAVTGQAALEAIGQAPFDVLVSDIAMPNYNGYDLIRAVRALDAGRGGQIPALALTAYARIEDRAEALAAGYQQHAAKPIAPAELAAAVATLAGRRTAR